jgi:hypothetical protein
MSINLPRERRGVVLRPRRALLPLLGKAEKWWVFDDLGPLDGPYETLDDAWTRIEEIYSADGY